MDTKIIVRISNDIEDAKDALDSITSVLTGDIRNFFPMFAPKLRKLCSEAIIKALEDYICSLEIDLEIECKK